MNSIVTRSLVQGILCFWSCFLQPAFSEDPGEQTVDFGRDVRPILSEKCFLCHGPAEVTREAGLRLDIREEAIGSGAIDLSNVSNSEILERVTSSDPELVMPPPETGKKVTPEEAQSLLKWIQDGAEYTTHWAFTAPVRPNLPRGFSTHPIDQFIHEKLQANGFEPAPQANSHTLVRRLYLDLLGLPPSPEELTNAIALDPGGKVGYEAVVDQLLESEHFGEHWARWWLDAARYADSDGYEKDKPRSVWFYRDWVIDALNADKPYSEFIVEQLAGDLLHGAGQDERVATGFLRNSMVNEEGGADPEQFRVEAMFDRVDAIGKAILGITTQCAQCHTHKYDPLSQREYYQMFAALNDFHEATISTYTPEQVEQRNAVLNEIEQIEAEVKELKTNWRAELHEWERALQDKLLDWQVAEPTDLPFEGQKFLVLDDGSVVSQSYAPTKATNRFSLDMDVGTITAVRLDALKHPLLPRGGPGRSLYGTGALSEFKLQVQPLDANGAPVGKLTNVKFKRAIAHAKTPEKKLPAIFRERDASKDTRVTGPIEYAIDGNGKTAWTTDVGPGQRNQDRLAIFVPQEPIVVDGLARLTFTLVQNHGGWNSDDNQNYLLGRYRFSITGDQSATAASFQPPPAEVEKVLRTAEPDRTREHKSLLFRYWVQQQAELVKQQERFAAAWSRYPETDSQLVVEARSEGPRTSFVFLRGDFLSRGDEVSAAVPNFLGDLPNSNEPDRLRFARWAGSKQSPTTARVIVNRIWQTYFGKGLVRTPEDFGFQGAFPTHPALLDWLAVELIDSGWSLKHIHRLIVTSATYKQSSLVRKNLRSVDPLNELLGVFPRLRVNAEVVRDSALAASGLLEMKIGGPSVYPPAPAFLFEPPTSYGPKQWVVSKDSSQYRRSLYIHSYRSVPFPALQIFDAPKGDAACVRRERSNTPLQALVMLNEPQFVEFARGLAGRILRECPSQADDERIAYGFRLVLSRPPKSTELDIVRQLLAKQRELAESGQFNAAELCGVSSSVCRQLTGVDVSEYGSWVIVARALLNLDEAITRQ